MHFNEVGIAAKDVHGRSRCEGLRRDKDTMPAEIITVLTRYRPIVLELI